MTPFFRDGEYGRGLLSGATRVAQRIAEGRNVNLDLAPAPQAQSRRRTRGGGFPIGFWVVLFLWAVQMPWSIIRFPRDPDPGFRRVSLSARANPDHSRETAAVEAPVGKPRSPSPPSLT